MAVLAKPRNLIEVIKSFGMEDVSTSRQQGLKDVLDQLQLSAGFNLVYPVNDCEDSTEFDESTSGEFDVTAIGSGKVGTDAILLTATTAESGYVSTDDIVESGPIPPDINGDQWVDWRDVDYIGWWQQCNTGFNTAGELTFRLKNNGTWSAAQNVAAGTDSVWQRQEIDISSLDRDKVQAIRFDNEAPITEAVEIDDIIRYKHSNGKGPVMGPCIAVQIKNGVTTARGNICEYESAAVRRLNLEAAAGVTTLGPCVIGGTGNAQGTVWGVVQIGGLAYLRASETIVVGEGVKWATGHKIAGASDGVDEQNFAKALEAGATNVDIMTFIAKAVTYIS